MMTAMKPALISSLLLLGASAFAAEPSESPDQSTEGSFSIQSLAQGLDDPWEVTWGPDNYLWITERTGLRITRVNPADGSKKIAVTISDAFHEEGIAHDGVLGLALHPNLLKGTNEDFVYVAFIQRIGAAEGQDIRRGAKIRRYTYDPKTEKLGKPLDILSGLPASHDHNSGRLIFGPDKLLYYPIGDQGAGQGKSYCEPILAQVLPSAGQIAAKDYSLYPGKILRLNLNGSIPSDNPILDGVRSHIYTYGHRNVQGMALGSNGNLYAVEHGPKTDDELSLLKAGKNYGWPYVAGYQDNQAYVYAEWFAAEGAGCEGTSFSEYQIPETVPTQKETEWYDPDFVPPLLSFAVVPSTYDFKNTPCGELAYICWPSIAPSGSAYYGRYAEAIPGWENSIITTGLKTGSLFLVKLNDDGSKALGNAVRLFRSENRYRDVAVSPDGKSIYISTDKTGNAASLNGSWTNKLKNPGEILVVRYGS